jgi:15-cis-phytoene synthase
MSQSTEVSAQIARRSKSNLAFALSTLSPQRRRDMIVFYAFCRVVDDIADDPVVSPDQKAEQLKVWTDGLMNGFELPDALQKEVSELPKRYNISPSLFVEIIEGVASDLDHERYETIKDLLGYCYKVASVVGLVSIEIFGYKNPACKEYAVNLGYALQLTNIIRDVGEDARETGRIYLPLEDLRKFKVSEQDILSGNHTPEFASMMKFQHQRALSYYSRAAELLPHEDRKHMLAARMMAKIYSEILEKIKRHQFRVFERRFGLSKIRKITILTSYTLRGLFKAV